MTLQQELTLAIAFLLQLSPLDPSWDDAHKKVGELKKAYVDSLVEQQPQPAPTTEVEIEKVAAKAKPKTEKPAKAKAGGVKSKEKLIIDMTAAELKKLADKHTIDHSTVNFRKADEKDAFRSKLAKVLGRSNELNYTVAPVK